MKLIALAALLLALLPVPSAQAVERWQNYNADPFARSREEAMARRAEVFSTHFRLSAACVQAAYAAMRAPGRQGRLTNGDRLAVMVSGHKVQRNVLVDLVQVDRGVEASPVTEEWEFTCDGQRQRIILPLYCNNWSLAYPSGAPQALQAPQQVATGVCPNGFRIVLHIWALSTLPPDTARVAMEIVAEAGQRDTQNATNIQGYVGRSFSRTLGRQLRFDERVKHAPITAQIAINYKDPRTMQLAQQLGFIQVWGGRGEFRLPDDPRNHVIELLLPDEFITSPMSGGRRRLMDLPTEWPDCVQNMHAGVL